MARQEVRYPRVGEEIDRFVRSLAAVKGWKMGRTMNYVWEQTNYGPDMIHRWRQGKMCPSLEVLELLARMGKEEANLPRSWGEQLLTAACHPATASLVDRLWGAKDLNEIPCNLPSREHTDLVGRRAEMAHLLELLSPEHAAPLITIDGIGGVGKTALVLEVAYRCWRKSIGQEHDATVPVFDAIIFVSAKQQYLMSEGLFPRGEASRTLRDIIREIASTLERFEITYVAPQEQFFQVRKVLSGQQVLLIVDNLETMEDKQEIMSFLYNLPRSVKVVMTTRERILSFSPIRLEQLPQEEALTFINKEAREKEAELTPEQALELYRHIGGIPAALLYAVGQIAYGHTVETVLKKIPQATSDVARFCFEGSLQPLRGQAAHHVLMAMAMFVKPPVRGALAQVAGLTADQITLEESVILLTKLSLIRQSEGRYSILPLTREYALSELAANPDFEREARARWAAWYLHFASEFGGKDWYDWKVRYDRIEEEWENLLAVFDWCATHEHYEMLYTFWQERHMVKFAHTYGYWDDRLRWLKWLIQGAEKRGYWSQVVKPMIDLSSTLTLMDQLEQADEYLQRAWELRTYTDMPVQLILVQKFINLRVQQKNVDDAFSWLKEGEHLLNSISSSIEEPERTRRWVDFQTYKGLVFNMLGDYDQAKLHYQNTLMSAEQIGWQRVAIYARNHLAFIAVAQDRLDDAEILLQMSLPVDKDKGLVAFHKHTLAYFYQKKGEREKAYQLAREARMCFERLGMRPEVKDMHELIQQLQA